MKNVLSTFAMLAILILICVAAWYFYTTNFLAEPFSEPLNAHKEIPGMLAAEKQKEIWEQEQAAIQIEHYVGKEFIGSLVEADPQRMTAMFGSDFSTFIPTDSKWVTVTRPPFEESIRVTGDQEGLSETDAVFFIDLIFPKVGGLKIDKSEFKVLKVVKTEDLNFACEILIAVSGIDDDSKYKRYENISEVGVRYSYQNGDENSAPIKQPDFANPVIDYWNAKRESFRVCDSADPFKEETEKYQLGTIGIQDQWKQATEARTPHHFQMAVEDFDLDGDYDIATLSSDGTPLVLGYEDGRFKNITSDIGVPETIENEHATELPQPVAWIDYDNDHYPDLVLGSRVFKNEAGKKFRDVSAAAGIQIEAGATGLTVVDFNNDGFLDLYATRTKISGETEQSPGWIDQSSSGSANQLFKNNGDGTFSNVSESTNSQAGSALSNAAGWLFHDDDHYPDLYIANDFGENILLVNQDSGSTFVDKTGDAGIVELANSQGVAVGDLNNDGAADVLVSNLFSNVGNRLMQQISETDYSGDAFKQIMTFSAGNHFYLRDKEGGYFDRTIEMNVVDSGWAWAPVLLDVDSDGFLDLYSANGHASFDRSQPDTEPSLWKSIVTQPSDRMIELPAIGRLSPETGELWESPIDPGSMNRNLASFQQNRLFLNYQGEKFLDASYASSSTIDSDSRSAIAADFNGDGDVDLLVGSAGGGPLRLFSNQMQQGNRIEVRLKGTKSNSHGIGARVTAQFKFKGVERKVVRDLFPKNGFMGIGPATVWIGVGKAEKIETLSVRWPTGETQVLNDVQVNRSIRIEEGNSEVETVREF